jgi:hypothetical protein
MLCGDRLGARQRRVFIPAEEDSARVPSNYMSMLPFVMFMFMLCSFHSISNGFLSINIHLSFRFPCPSTASPPSDYLHSQSVHPPSSYPQPYFPPLQHSLASTIHPRTTPNPRHSPLVVSPKPCVTPVTASPRPLPAPATTLPVVSVMPETPLPMVLVAAPATLPMVC